jgi:ribosomal protein S18 acetylase RimI-like enzyme
MNATAANIEIVEFRPEFRKAFERLNREWIEKYFRMEEMDEYILTNPESAILAGGGAILFARRDNTIAGTVALRSIDERTVEVTKMAVDPAFRRQGIAEQLIKQAIEKARELGAKNIVLFSHTSLEPALTLYRKVGFVEVPLGSNEYVRSNIKMELVNN